MFLRTGIVSGVIGMDPEVSTLPKRSNISIHSADCRCIRSKFLVYKEFEIFSVNMGIL